MMYLMAIVVLHLASGLAAFGGLRVPATDDAEMLHLHEAGRRLEFNFSSSTPLKHTTESLSCIC